MLGPVSTSVLVLIAMAILMGLGSATLSDLVAYLRGSERHRPLRSFDDKVPVPWALIAIVVAMAGAALSLSLR
jgi:hypothetical protein